MIYEYIMQDIGKINAVYIACSISDIYPSHVLFCHVLFCFITFHFVLLC